jgi:phosphatidylserine decarboxylase
MIKIHKEGRGIVILTVTIVLGINFLTGLFLSILLLYIISIASIAVLVLIIRFFRVPNRQLVKNDTLIVAPADGKVVAIEKTFVDEFLNEERIQISIFMSIHNVHINYYPMDGSVVYYKYHPGRYLLASHPKSSSLNERSSIGIKNDKTTILIRQIAGYVARRVKCYAEKDKTVRQGEELGFIKFGSRVDVFVPADAKILVKLDEPTFGGITPLVSLNKDF